MTANPDTALAIKVAELERRLNNMIVFGRVEAADYPAARVKVRLNASLVTGWLRWATPRAHDEHVWDAPEIGEQVMILSRNGELALGVVQPAIAFNDYPALFDGPSKVIRKHSDGAEITYDRDAHSRTVELPAAGTHVHKVAGATRTHTGERIDDAAETVTQTAGSAKLSLRADIGRAKITGDLVQILGEGGDLKIDASKTVLKHGDTSLELNGTDIIFRTASGTKLILNTEVLLGSAGASRKVARVGDSVAGGLITTGSDAVKSL